MHGLFCWYARMDFFCFRRMGDSVRVHSRIAEDAEKYSASHCRIAQSTVLMLREHRHHVFAEGQTAVKAGIKHVSAGILVHGHSRGIAHHGHLIHGEQ